MEMYYLIYHSHLRWLSAVISFWAVNLSNRWSLFYILMFSNSKWKVFFRLQLIQLIYMNFGCFILFKFFWTSKLNIALINNLHKKKMFISCFLTFSQFPNSWKRNDVTIMILTIIWTFTNVDEINNYNLVLTRISFIFLFDDVCKNTWMYFSFRSILIWVVNFSIHLIQFNLLMCSGCNLCAVNNRTKCKTKCIKSESIKTTIIRESHNELKIICKIVLKNIKHYYIN